MVIFRRNTKLNNEDTLFSASIYSNAALVTTLLFIFLVPWADSVYDGLPRLTATLALGFTVLKLLFHGVRPNFTFFHIATILYFAWLILSVVWSPDFERADQAVKTTFQLMLLAFMFCFVIDNKPRLIAIYQVYVFAGMIAAGIVFSNFLRGIESGYLRYGIQNLTIDAVGVFLSIAIPIAAYLAKFSPSKYLRLLNLTAIPLIFYGIFLTATRTAFIVGIIGLLYWLFTQRKASMMIKVGIFIVMIAAFSTALFLAPKSSIERLSTVGESVSEGTLNSRSTIWGGSINQWKDSPIIGVGLGGLGKALSLEHINYDAAHNSFIHIMTENGIIGLLLYLMVNFSLLIYIMHMPINEKAFLFAFLMTIVVSQLATHLQSEKITWFVYTMIAVHTYMYSNFKRHTY